MKIVKFDEAERYEPEPDWKRIALAGSSLFSFEWFHKAPGHSSPMHHHENEQVCICLEGELIVHTEDSKAVLEPYDSVWLEADEPHRVENRGSEVAIGLDVFAPGRSFDFWTRRKTGDSSE